MYNFAPAGPDAEDVYGACRPKHPRRAPGNDTVEDWLNYMNRHRIRRVCCLLADQHLREYDDLIARYAAQFGEERVLHAPVTDFTMIDRELLTNRVVPFLEAAVDADERVVVHCSAGSGRTGHVLVLWLAYRHGYSIEDAVEAVRGPWRDPLEAVSIDALRSMLDAIST